MRSTEIKRAADQRNDGKDRVVFDRWLHPTFVVPIIQDPTNYGPPHHPIVKSRRNSNQKVAHQQQEWSRWQARKKYANDSNDQEECREKTEQNSLSQRSFYQTRIGDRRFGFSFTALRHRIDYCSTNRQVHARYTSPYTVHTSPDHVFNWANPNGIAAQILTVFLTVSGSPFRLQHARKGLPVFPPVISRTTNEQKNLPRHR